MVSLAVLLFRVEEFVFCWFVRVVVCLFVAIYRHWEVRVGSFYPQDFMSRALQIMCGGLLGTEL